MESSSGIPEEDSIGPLVEAYAVMCCTEGHILIESATPRTDPAYRQAGKKHTVGACLIMVGEC